jgi:hypothetical protein
MLSMGRRHVWRWPYLLPPLVLALILLLWARSYLPDRTIVRFHRGRIALFFAAGSAEQRFDPASSGYFGTYDAIAYCRRVAQANNYPAGGVAGFEWIGIGKSDYLCVLLIPFWAVALAALGATVWAWLAYRRRRDRDLPGHCRACGYDLKGNVSGVCPECGAAAVVVKEAA